MSEIDKVNTEFYRNCLIIHTLILSLLYIQSNFLHKAVLSIFVLYLYSNSVHCVVLIGKTPEEIRKTFNIKNDFTPEEEEQVS